MNYSELLVPPITLYVDHTKHASVSHCFVPVYCGASVYKLGSSCCPPSLCLAWLSTELSCQSDILSHHVLTHLLPGLVKAFVAHFSGPKASRALFCCINPSLSLELVGRSYHLMVSRGVYLHKQRFTPMSAWPDQRNGVILSICIFLFFFGMAMWSIEKENTDKLNETWLHFIQLLKG